MLIRTAEIRDIPALLDLLYQVGQVHHEIRPDIFPPATLKYDASALEALLADPDRPVFVAEIQGRVTGYCFCVCKRYGGSCAVSRLEIYIDDLCVDEQFRGQGIAKALYRHACRFGRDLGARFVALNVWCGNDSAMAFYEKLGMKPRHIMMEMPLEELC